MIGPPTVLVAAGTASSLVTEIGWCLLVAGVLAVTCERLRLPSIAGFILGGVLIGPDGLSIVSSRGDIETIANLGLALLLFLVGLEINLRALVTSGRVILVTGLLQVPLTTAAGLVVLWLLGRAGLPFLTDPTALVYLAVACSFSSTLLVAKALQERLLMDTVDGRICIALLVFQDLWAIVVLSFQPNLEHPSVVPLLSTLAGVAVVIALAAAATRFVLPALFSWVARIPEMIVTLALAWCFGLGLLASHLGDIMALFGIDANISVSMEMGALIAGASIATFPYAHEVVSKVGNLRDFFITLFFVALGMTVHVPDDLRIVGMAALLALVLVAMRFAVFLPLLYASGLDRRHAVTSSAKLSQASEFALVIAYLGLGLGHIDETVVTIVVFAFIVTAVATPAVFAQADRLHGMLVPLLAMLGIRQAGPELSETPAGPPPRLVLLGFHRLASSLLHDIGSASPQFVAETLVVDINVALHDKIRATGARVVYGDVSNPTTLAHTVVGASVVVCTIPDDILRGSNNIEIARLVRRINPDAVIIVNAVDLRHARFMYKAGADYVFSWRIETALGLLPAIRAAVNGELESYLATRRAEATEPTSRVEVIP